MATQIPVDERARAAPETGADGAHAVCPDLAYRRLLLVNVAFFGPFGVDRERWVLIDAGVTGTTGLITSTVDERFGGAPPAAIILTHGHFDHVGALEELARRWDVPVYAHPLERPYLDGSASYPPPDPKVGGGLMSTLSPLYPRGPIDVSERLRELPEDGSIPFMPGWRWMHTPGHSAGHVSLWRARDRTLIAGDAFVTTRQEAAYASMVTQPAEMHGPPMYYTPDWEAARESVRRLAALEPELVVTGHGPAMQGGEMRRALHELADRFDAVAVPKTGEYVSHPARVEDGSAYDRTAARG